MRALAAIIIDPHGEAVESLDAEATGNPYPGRVWVGKAGRDIRILYRVEEHGVAFVKIALRRDAYKTNGKKDRGTGS